MQKRKRAFYPLTNEDWHIPSPEEEGEKRLREKVGETYEELQERIKNCIYSFLDGLYDEEEGALHHYYRAEDGFVSKIDSGNFLMALNYVVAYDLYGDAEALQKAESCFLWAYENATETHPMYIWQGGVQSGRRPDELFVKYTADALITCLALYERTGKKRYLFYVKKFHNFIKGARKNGFKAKYDKSTYSWHEKGYCWHSFGRVITAYLDLYRLKGQSKYRREALAWGEDALTRQAEDGSFYLIDDEFWNSDLTADELRSLIFLYETTGKEKFLDSACRFADWLLKKQRDDGAWPIGIDREGEVSAPDVGPGDVPNIGISLVRLHRHIREGRYLRGAVQALKYSLEMQAVEGGRYPYHLDDPRVKWGFWSWEPLGDHSLSGDQSIHHIRGISLIGSYLGS